VGADGLTLGRDEECSVVLDDPNVSRFHARLVFHNAAIWVQDAGSRNGVFLNGKRVVRHKQLGPGDELLIGDHGFTLELEMAAPQPSLTGTIVATAEVKSNRNLVLAACAILLVSGLLIWLGTS
jgi:pSer/pThr/pTyr-binding forkhead associated (FHA) protein